MKSLYLTLFVSFIVSLPMKAQAQSTPIEGKFVHMVFFWLKNPESNTDRESFKKALNQFMETNPQVISTHIGQPAPTNRPVIDNSYTYSLVVSFPDLATQNAYQVDPSHLLFVEQAQALWDKVVVYDSISE